MPVHPQAQAIIDLQQQAGIDPASLQPAEMRTLFDLPAAENPEEVGGIDNRTLVGPRGDIPVRIYTPEGPGPFPLLLFFHGGGFVIGNLETHDSLCRALCNSAECVVVAVDYRLAPEQRYPAAHEDCYAATMWAYKHAAEINGLANKLAVAGDSAGGTMAAVVCLVARDQGGPPIEHQLLLYPITDRDFETQSYKDNAEGYFLTRDMMKWFWGHYLATEADGQQAYAAPLRAEIFSGLPSATIITAEYDPLRDEAEHYAQCLLGAGVKTELIRYSGMIHGFLTFPEAIDAANAGIATVGNKLREALAASSR